MTPEEITALKKEVADAKAEKEKAQKEAANAKAANSALVEQVKKLNATTTKTGYKTKKVDDVTYNITYPTVAIDEHILKAEDIQDLDPDNKEERELLESLIKGQVLVKAK